MDQKLYAFFKWDNWPIRVLGGEVESFTAKGNVIIKNFSGGAYAPLMIMPYEDGVKLNDQLKALQMEHEEKKRALMAEYKAKADALKPWESGS